MAKTDIQRSSSLLHHSVKREHDKIHKAWAAAGLKMKTTETLRYGERQHMLFKEGKSKLDRGKGMHEFGVAWDVCVNIKGHEYDPVILKKAAKIAKEVSPHVVWGGDWEGFVDMPHFQYTYPYTQEQIRAGKRPK